MDKQRKTTNGPQIATGHVPLWRALSGPDPAPSETAPTPPGGEGTPLTIDQIRRLSRPTDPQEGEAASMAREIAAAPNFADDFGKFAPPGALMANLMTQAALWSQHQTEAEAWAAYVRNQRLLAWDAALHACHAFQDDFETAAKHDPTVVTRYPSVARFFAVSKAGAARAVATRRAHQHEAAKAAATSGQPPTATGTDPAGVGAGGGLK